MELTPDEIARITDYLDASTPLPERADLIFVFGSRYYTPAEMAGALFSWQFAPLITVTGGVNPKTGVNEAVSHTVILVKAGVPVDKIIVEERSTNTLENVTFALPLIEQKVKLSSLRSVVAVCKWMHSRRALMTLKKHFPRSIRYYAHTYAPEMITRENWHLNPRAEGANVLKNWESIPKYLAVGHIEEITRDGDSYI
jgi:uncharacterized SAM-binding protein YcdF (DUF218 family)